MIDIGSGSGILSIAGCKLGVTRVLGVDNDPEAVTVSAANADKNQITGQVDFIRIIKYQRIDSFLILFY